MNRQEFQRLAAVRLREAEALLAAGLWDGAYYLAGYAVECGLKACIAKLTQAGDFPPSPEKARELYTHDLGKLLKLAGLKLVHDARAANDPPFLRNWVFCTQWSEQVRYERRGESAARELIAAVADPLNGVLLWLKQHW